LKGLPKPEQQVRAEHAQVTTGRVLVVQGHRGHQ
jgi:hypothetical protein